MKVAVLMGGSSDEREVSLASGEQVVRALGEAGVEVEGVDRRSVFEFLEAPAVREADVCFLALHGGAGEDGTLQALLSEAGVTYTGSDHLGCALAMDKDVSKRLVRDAGMATPPWLTAPPELDAARVVDRLGLPVVVKASGGGSSLRLEVARTPDEVADALERSRTWDDVVVVERWVAGREVTVGILGDGALPVGEIVPAHAYFDYACKYEPGLAEEKFPAPLDGHVAERIAGLALAAHRALRLRDFSRVDFILDAEGSPWFLEANALPGLTANSLLPKAAAAAGIGFPELCLRIVTLAARRRGRARNPADG